MANGQVASRVAMPSGITTRRAIPTFYSMNRPVNKRILQYYMSTRSLFVNLLRVYVFNFDYISD